MKIRRLIFPVSACVLLLHMAALWTLHSGLMRRHTTEIIVPVEILRATILPSQALPIPKPQLALANPPRHQQAQAQKPATRAQPLLAQNPEQLSSRPSPPAPEQLSTVPIPAQATIPSTESTPTNTSLPPSATNTAPAPASMPTELPSSNAAYLNNPKPAYPALSRRLGEQGKVVVRVLIGVDGSVQQAEIRSSSGYDRLDQSALATVRSWRYRPGRRNGVAEAMWFSVPLTFVLE